MSAEAVIIQAGQGKALSSRGTQVAYKAEGKGQRFSNSRPHPASTPATTSTARLRRFSTWSRASSRSAPAIKS